MSTLKNILPAAVAILVLTTSQIQARKASNLNACQQDECSMKPEHFALYSFVKNALDSHWDITGKEIYPLLQAVDVLERRYESELGTMTTLNGTEIVHQLLTNDELLRAVKIFKSDEGSALVDFYSSPISGKSRSIACSDLRVQALRRASKKLDKNLQLDGIFRKIHGHYLRKSAKRCLKFSCHSIENSMSHIHSAMGKYQPTIEELAKLVKRQNSTETTDINETSGECGLKREFESQELELCKFLKMSNSSDCTITANEMKPFNLTFDGKDSLKTSEYYKLVKHYNAGKSSNRSEVDGLIDGKLINQQCTPMRSLLEYHLSGLKYYQAQGLIDEQKLNSRTFWCPSLAYWMQLERICGDLLASSWKSVIISMTSNTYEMDKPPAGRSINSIAGPLEFPEISL